LAIYTRGCIASSTWPLTCLNEASSEARPATSCDLPARHYLCRYSATAGAIGHHLNSRNQEQKYLLYDSDSRIHRLQWQLGFPVCSILILFYSWLERVSRASAGVPTPQTAAVSKPPCARSPLSSQRSLGRRNPPLLVWPA